VIYIGIDPSSTNTGVVIFVGDEVSFKLLSPNKVKDFDERVVFILKELKKIYDNFYGLDVAVAMESPSYMSKGRTSQLSMLCGAIYYWLLVNNVPVTLVQPSKLKKFFTGDGRADKGKMISIVPKSIMVQFNDKHKKVDDLADAYALAKFIKDKTEGV